MTRRENIFDEFTALSHIAMGMRERGVQVDPVARASHDKKLSEILVKTEAAFHEMTGNQYILGKSGNSGDLKKLFFEDLGLTPLSYTDTTKQPQLNAKFLEHVIATHPQQGRKIAQAILKYRRMSKLHGTYVSNLPVDKKRPSSGSLALLAGQAEA